VTKVLMLGGLETQGEISWLLDEISSSLEQAS
jgi:hypothetical protein